MWLADTSVKRPVFATMVIMALVVLGAVSYPEIGVDLFPKVDFPIVTVQTTLKGASPEVIDLDVTDKIEGAVNTINGVKSITSSSIEGESRITIEFVLERNIDLAVQDVREKVALIRKKLPDEIEEPRIAKVDPDATAVLWLNLSGQKTIRELSTYVDEVLKEQFQRIDGVGDIQLGGLQLRQVRVWLDAKKLRAYGVAASDVMAALKRENIELPGGRIESQTKEYTIKVKGEFPTATEFNDVIVAYDKGIPVRIREIGRWRTGWRSGAPLPASTAFPLSHWGSRNSPGRTRWLSSMRSRRDRQDQQDPTAGDDPEHRHRPVHLHPPLHRRGAEAPDPGELLRGPGGLHLPRECPDDADQRAGPADLDHRDLCPDPGLWIHLQQHDDAGPDALGGTAHRRCDHRHREHLPPR
jgi:hypothetical protein